MSAERIGALDMARIVRATYSLKDGVAVEQVVDRLVEGDEEIGPMARNDARRLVGNVAREVGREEHKRDLPIGSMEADTIVEMPQVTTVVFPRNVSN